MYFRVLGSIEMHTGTGLVDVGPPRQRSILAALAVDAGRPVLVETLIERVWDEPPDRVRHALYVYVARLRQVLRCGDDGPDPVQVVRRSGGYLLDVDPERVDLHRFRALVDRARQPDLTNHERAAMLGEARELWRGVPLAGVPGQWAERVREGARQQYLDATVRWAQALVDLGEPAGVIDALGELTAEYPLSEPVAAALIRALYADGRGAEALDRYAQFRGYLAEQLGTDPGVELRELHRVLLWTGATNTPVPAPAGGGPHPVHATVHATVPTQLPLDVPGFTGREAELARLDALLAAAGEQTTAVVVSAVSGTAGIGKTALAVHWAHAVRERFPDGQLYVNLRGFDPGGQIVDPATALGGFLGALGVPPQRIPTDLDAQAALYRSLLTGREMLIVLDNARDSAQVRPLLPGAPRCLVVVTSRNHLTGLIADAGAHSITLDLLTDREAQRLLAHRLGTDRVAAEARTVAEIITRCARLPLALTLVAARATICPGIGLHVLAEQLRDTQLRWQTLTGDDPATDVRGVFSWSYHTLTPPAARLFRLLGLHPAPGLTAPATASLAALPIERVRPLLAELTRANLLTEHSAGRYLLHDLLHAYAAHLAETTDTEDQRRAGVHRLLDHYLHTAYAADRLLYPARDPITLAAPQPGVAPEQLTDHRQALAWFTAEHAVLMAAADHAATAGFDTHTWQLAWTLRTFFTRRGHLHDWATSARAAVAAAAHLADPAAQIHARLMLAQADTRLGRFHDAHVQLTHALELCRQAGDPTVQAHTHLALAHLCERQSQSAKALDHSRQALQLYRSTGNRNGLARALNSVGWHYAQVGDHQQSVAYCQQALAVMETLGGCDARAATWDTLGYALHHLGHHAQAVDCYRRAIDQYRDAGERYWEAMSLRNLGDLHCATGDPDAADAAYRQALTILTDLGDPDADTVRTKVTFNRWARATS
jgi:DNA-binding SARP family transcriptional activator/tetratricopeptide (TPR) repeat protein